MTAPPVCIVAFAYAIFGQWEVAARLLDAVDNARNQEHMVVLRPRGHFSNLSSTHHQSPPAASEKVARDHLTASMSTQKGPNLAVTPQGDPHETLSSTQPMSCTRSRPPGLPQIARASESRSALLTCSGTPA